MGNTPTFRNDIEVAWPDTNGAITEFDDQVAPQNQEQIVGVWVGVPRELAVDLGYHYTVSIKWVMVLGAKRK